MNSRDVLDCTKKITPYFSYGKDVDKVYLVYERYLNNLQKSGYKILDNEKNKKQFFTAIFDISLIFYLDMYSCHTLIPPKIKTLSEKAAYLKKHTYDNQTYDNQNINKKIYQLFCELLFRNQEKQNLQIFNNALSQNDFYANNLMHLAIYYNNITLLKEILEKKPELLFCKNYEGKTPLEFAGMFGTREAMEVLIEFFSDEKGHEWIECFTKEISQPFLFIVKGKCANVYSLKNLLSIAIAYNNTQVAELLLEKCPKLIFVPSKEKFRVVDNEVIRDKGILLTPIGTAIKYDRIEILKLLLKSQKFNYTTHIIGYYIGYLRYKTIIPSLSLKIFILESGIENPPFYKSKKDIEKDKQLLNFYRPLFKEFLNQLLDESNETIEKIIYEYNATYPQWYTSDFRNSIYKPDFEKELTRKRIKIPQDSDFI